MTYKVLNRIVLTKSMQCVCTSSEI